MYSLSAYFIKIKIVGLGKIDTWKKNLSRFRLIYLIKIKLLKVLLKLKNSLKYFILEITIAIYSVVL